MPVAVSSTPAAVAAATPCGPRISTAAAAPTLSPNGSWPSETTAISTAIASKTRGVHADRVQHQPVPRDLREHRDQHEAHQSRAAVLRAQHGQALAEPARVRGRDAPEREPHGAHGHDTHDRRPPGQAERADERERGERRQRGLDEEDRQLGRDQGGDMGGLLRRRAPQRRDARGRAELAVQELADAAEARRPVELAAAHRPAGGVHAHAPCLAARDQRHHLERHRQRDHAGRGARDAGLELVPLADEHDHQRGARDDRCGHREAAAAHGYSPRSRASSLRARASSRRLDPALESRRLLVAAHGVTMHRVLKSLDHHLEVRHAAFERVDRVAREILRRRRPATQALEHAIPQPLSGVPTRQVEAST